MQSGTARFECSDCDIDGGPGPTARAVYAQSGDTYLTRGTVFSGGAGTVTARGLEVVSPGSAHINGVMFPGNTGNSTVNAVYVSGAVFDMVDSWVYKGNPTADAAGCTAVYANSNSQVRIERSIFASCSTATLASQTLDFQSVTAAGSVTLLSNVVQGAGSNAPAIFIASTAAPVKILNNWVTTGPAASSTGILVNSNSGPVDIANNYINNSQTDAGSAGLYITTFGTANTIRVANNRFGGTGCAIYYGSCIASPYVCTTRCSLSAGNVKAACTFTGPSFPTWPAAMGFPALSASDTSCKGTGADPTSYPSGSAFFPAGYTDVQNESRPQGSWDVGPDEIN